MPVSHVRNPQGPLLQPSMSCAAVVLWPPRLECFTCKQLHNASAAPSAHMHSPDCWHAGCQQIRGRVQASIRMGLTACQHTLTHFEAKHAGRPSVPQPTAFSHHYGDEETDPQPKGHMAETSAFHTARTLLKEVWNSTSSAHVARIISNQELRCRKQI